MLVYRLCKARYAVFDAEGARRMGGRWNSPGKPVLYCSECFAGSILEIVAHALPRRLPGAHHAARARIPSGLRVEVLDENTLPEWDAGDQSVSRAFGDRWLGERRTVVLSVPALSGKPFARSVLLNPAHPDFHRIEVERSVPIVWDPRLLGP
jgi:RES domain-containing protein